MNGNNTDFLKTDIRCLKERIAISKDLIETLNLSTELEIKTKRLEFIEVEMERIKPNELEPEEFYPRSKW